MPGVVGSEELVAVSGAADSGAAVGGAALVAVSGAALVAVSGAAVVNGAVATGGAAHTEGVCDGCDGSSARASSTW